MDTLPSRPVAPAAVPAAQVRARIVLAGEQVPLQGDPVALPAGARFSVQLHSSHDGTVELLALGPGGGAASSLWQQAVAADGQARSPMLRLDGARGVERLYVLLRDVHGRVVAERALRIWHL